MTPAPVPAEGSFPAGTRIDTPEAPRRIEDLVPGDQVQTLAGIARTIMRIQKRQIDIAAHPNPARVTPIRLRAGALAPGRPSRDLLLPPESLLFFHPESDPPDPEGVLIPAASLVNGTSIAREPATGLLTWFALELDQHDIVLADATPAASCREPRHPDGTEPLNPREKHPREKLCAPLLPPGPALATLRRQLANRPETPSAQPTIVGAPQPTEPDPYANLQIDPAQPLHLFVDGAELPPLRQKSPDASLHRFKIPPASGPARLISAAALSPAPSDTRRLGVCVTSLNLDGTELDLDGKTLGPGFHPTESDQSGRWRWTDGRAWLVLPHSTNAQTLAIRINDWHQMLARQ